MAQLFRHRRNSVLQRLLKKWEIVLKILLFANTDWYLYNFRKKLALSLCESGHEVILVSPRGQYSDIFVSLGLRWQELPMDRSSLNPIKELRSVLRLRRIVKTEAPDIVHGFTIKGVIYCSIAACFTDVKALINSIDGLGYIFSNNDFKAIFLRPLILIILKFLFYSSKVKLILQNNDDVTLFKNLKIIKLSKLHLIQGVGVNCKQFSAGGVRLSGMPLKVLLATRLLWNKGILEFVEAARILKAQGRNIQFILAGIPDAGNPDSVSLEFIHRCVDEGLIDWLGHVEDMAALYASINVVTLPSFYREGLPTVLVEGAACGLPLITTDNPGCRDVVTNEVDGLLIPIRDPKALAFSIARLDENPEFSARLGLGARAKALNLYEMNLVIQKTIDIYLSSI
jgi:glycosyltransferase involved in cell wall biosynthesis